MWINVRTMDGKRSVQLDGLSKLSKIELVKERLTKEFDVPADRQRLFFNGKQLESDHTLFDYNVGLNALVQLMIRPIMSDIDDVIKPMEDSKKPLEVNGNHIKIENQNGVDHEMKDNSQDKDKSQIPNGHTDNEETIMNSTYQVGNLVDAKDLSIGAWFEATIIKITKDKKDSKKLLYHVQFDGYDENNVPQLDERYVRPRAKTIIPWDDLKIGETVMVNYNIEEHNERGFWYDMKITSKTEKRNKNQLHGTLLLSNDESMATKCVVQFVDEVFAIEKAGSGSCSPSSSVPEKRKVKPDCDRCKDNPDKLCKECACHKCGGKDKPDKQIMCDECDMAYHIMCLDPPLESIPDVEEWYCPLCKHDDSKIVRAGEKLKESKKKSKMASAVNSTSRDWGKGMACVGRTKVCTLVPPNHFGPVPGVPVGSLWKFRLQVSEAGIHRPHVSGIHGREGDGAYSIVLAGGYEDDEDKGDTFFYTGSGGRDLSGNKRTAEQSCDQKLTKMNKALAKNCDAPLDDKKGAEAKNWRNGKPVRVVRSAKFRKHSKFAPEEGNRYDGIYKVVKYWPEKGKSGFIVWRYKFQRDDEMATPWSREGKKFSKEHGLVLQFPPGYLEAQAKKANRKSSDSKTEESTNSNEKDESDDGGSPSAKRTKLDYNLPKDILSAIEKDTENSKPWIELTTDPESYQKFLSRVEEYFTCICCQDVVFKPITTTCLHNLCKECLKRAFKAQLEGCPVCRTPIDKEAIKVNENLASILKTLFPGYEAMR